MASYEELQSQAQALGLPYDNVSKKDLAKSIKAAQSLPDSEEELSSTETADTQDDPLSNELETVDDENIPTVKTQEDPDPEPEESLPLFAKVVKQGRVIRQYSLVNHGERFIELAQEFAAKQGAVVEPVY